MPEPPKTPAARPRPLPDLPVAAVAAHAGELSRRWAVALVLDRPPELIGEVPLQALADHGPEVCERVLLALQSDAALTQLLDGAGGAAAVSRLAARGAGRDALAAARSVEALRGVLWEELAARLLGAPVSVVAGAADRLAHVCALLAGQSLAAGGVKREQPNVPAPESGGPAPVIVEGTGGTGAVRIVDERGEPGASSATGPAAAAGVATERRADLGDTAGDGAGTEEREIAVRDQRAARGPSVWIESIGAALERYEHGGVPFAVLLVQASDPQVRAGQERRTLASGRIAEVEALLAGVLRAVAEPDMAGRGVGALTREHAGRYWLLAPGVDRAGAQELAERLTGGAAAAARARLWALEVAVGTASCPQDGRTAAELAAHADVGLYAARAAARTAAAREAGQT